MSGQGTARHGGDHLRCKLMRPLLDIQPMTGKLHGSFKPSRREHVLRVIPPPPMLQSRQHARPRGAFNRSADSTWSVEEP